MAGVRFEQVVKRFGTVSVIENLDLEVHDHEFMVLVGPSGCGKTTALRIIAGLEELTAGRIFIGDRLVNDLPPKDRDIAMVFQSYALYPHMTVRENIAFGLRIRKMPRAEIDRRVGEATATLGIEKLLDRKPKELSGGQRQRVAVARAIVRDPAVFLFDEPLSNLDAKLRVQMRAEISKLQQRLGTTVVYVTHDQIEAMTMGHRIAVMQSGRIQQVGPPLEVYDKPRTAFVAQFIGTPPMSFFDAVVEDGTLKNPAFTTPLPPALRGRIAAGVAVLAGIRPENVREREAGAQGASAPIHGTIEIVEPVGHEAIVHVRAGDAMLVAPLDVHRGARIGETIDLEIETEALHLFDAKTQQRIE